jgi:pimeloyl-ACP methyl ester carboxylesterase
MLSSSPLSVASDARRVIHRRLPRDPRIEYLAHVPPAAPASAQVAVAVHGISRNASEHLELFAPHAEAAGMALVAPIFPQATFGKYQRLAPKEPGLLRSDHALLRILDDVARTFDVDCDRVFLCGFSGGAQFAHRFAMAYPERVRSAVITAAGWYTLPTPELAYPLGIGPPPHGLGLSFDPERFLRARLQVLVGPRDVSRDWALRKTPQLDELQGLTRVERGQRWVAAMQDAARAIGIEAPDIRFDLLPGGRHSFGKAMRRWGLGEATFARFVGPFASSPQQAT